MLNAIFVLVFVSNIAFMFLMYYRIKGEMDSIEFLIDTFLAKYEEENSDWRIEVATTTRLDESKGSESLKPVVQGESP